MEQLNGIDASFLNMETPTVHGHVGSVAVFDSSETTLTLDALKAVIEDRLHEVPPYRRRLMTVPLGLDRPYWIEDGDFDLDFHVRNIAVPPPGGNAQVAELVARLHSRPLDRSRPLWELYLIEGLEGGLVAQYTKIHHACIDGVTGTEVLTSLLDLQATGRDGAPEVIPWSPDRVPGTLEMLNRGLFALATQPRVQARLQARMARAAVQVGRRQAGPTMQTLREALERTPFVSALVPAVLGPGDDGEEAAEEFLSRPALVAPRVSFNRTITAHRRYAFGTLPLAEVKQIKDQYGYTVNDVVMAICAGGLRTWLQDRHELPTDPLLAMVPVSIRTDADARSFGNRLSAMIAPLPTNRADPLQRLRAAHDAMAIAKDEHAAMPADMLQDFGHFAPPAVAARVARLVARTGLANYASPSFNLVISNVPGPQHPLYCAGARLAASYPVSVITDGAGLNITLFSYDGGLHFGLVACRELVPDLWDLMDALDNALTELVEAARADDDGRRRRS
jgi:WS/DGAT/MGAT family acyltransferase